MALLLFSHGLLAANRSHGALIRAVGPKLGLVHLCWADLLKHSQTWNMCLCVCVFVFRGLGFVGYFPFI